MRSLFIVPHPDDELLGCGGTILKKISSGHDVGIVLMTSVTVSGGWSEIDIKRKKEQFNLVCQKLQIHPRSVFRLDFPAATLDQIPFSQLVQELSFVFNTFLPEEIFLPHPGDIHTDHKVTFEVAASFTKWFRYPTIQKVLTYETLSETNFSINPLSTDFSPNLFVDISQFLEQKLSLLSIYNTELLKHPFPRSLSAVKALALLRGSQRGVEYAEAFHLLRHFE